jgi:hypothetical protein
MSASNDPPRTRGRKPLFRDPLRKVLVTLDEATIRKAKRIGFGNLSMGLRAAVHRASLRPVRGREIER